MEGFLALWKSFLGESYTVASQLPAYYAPYRKAGLFFFFSLLQGKEEKLSSICWQALGVMWGALHRDSSGLSQKIMSVLCIREHGNGSESLWLRAPVLGLTSVTYCVT